MPGLLELPPELLNSIFRYLSVNDFTNLSVVDTRLRDICSDPFVCKEIIARTVAFTKEANDLDGDKPQDTISRIRNRRRAVAKGQPRLAVSLGAASDFLFNQGVICWTRSDSRTISIFETKHRGSQINVLIDELLPKGMLHHTSNIFKLTHYSDGILSILYEEDADGQQYLIVASTPLDSQSKCYACCLRCVAIDDSFKLFVRNTTSYLFYGTHSFVGSHGHQEWLIRGLSLRDDQPFLARSQSKRTEASGFNSMAVFLTDFVGDQTGSTADFLIHDNFFYAVTNVDDFDVVEIDWTSFYHCYRFPVNDPHPSSLQVHHGIFRRQHLEGPMHDGWLKLNLQIDERTNEVLIVETRKEWLSSRDHHRSVYLTKVCFPDVGSPEEMDTNGFRGTLLANDPFAQYATTASKFKESRKRKSWTVHHEELNLRMGITDRRATRTPLLAHTKYHTYDVASKTLIDLVEDFSCCSKEFNAQRGHGCLRLRTSSRQYRPVSRDVRRGHDHMKAAQPVDDFESYYYTPVSVWPSSMIDSEYAAVAHELMGPPWSPHGETKSSGLVVDAVSDERTIVMLIRSSANDDDGKLVVLGFDSRATIGPPDHSGQASDRFSTWVHDPHMAYATVFRDETGHERLLSEHHYTLPGALFPEGSLKQRAQSSKDICMDEERLPDLDLTTKYMFNPDTNSWAFLSTNEHGLESEKVFSRSWIDIWIMNLKGHSDGVLNLKQESNLEDVSDPSDNTSEPESTGVVFESSGLEWNWSDDMSDIIDLDFISC